jgi:hypothetical protein
MRNKKRLYSSTKVDKLYKFYELFSKTQKSQNQLLSEYNLDKRVVKKDENVA